MKINALKAVIALITIIVLSANALNAKALLVSNDTYACDYDLRIDIGEEKSVNFTQQLNLANLKETELLTSISLNIPFAVENIIVRNGLLSSPQLIDAEYRDGAIKVNLGKYFVGSQQSATFTLTYTAKDLVGEDLNGWKSFFLPKLEICQSPFNTVAVNYPEAWGETKYSSINDTTKQTAMFWSDRSSFNIELDIEQGFGKVVALPSSNFNELAVTKINGEFDAFKDSWGNEYLVSSNVEGNKGLVQASINAKQTPINLPIISPEFYTKQSFIADEYQLTSKTRSLRYQELIGRYNPSLTVNSNPQLSYSEDALGYALAWARSLEAEGANPYIVFGPVSVPSTQEYFWNYWVAVMVNGKWVEYDPYFEDAFGFDGYEKVTPLRQTWGTINSENLFLIESLNNISKQSKIFFKSEQSSLVLGDSFDIRAEILADNEIARDISMKFINNTSHIVYLDEIKFEHFSLPKDLYYAKGILPYQQKTLKLNNSINIRDFVAKGEEQNAEVLGLINGQTVNIPTKITISHNAVIYSVFFFVLLSFYFLVLKLIINTKQDVVLHLQTFKRLKPNQKKSVTDVVNDSNDIAIDEASYNDGGKYPRRTRL